MDEEEVDWKKEYEKAISMLASVRSDLQEALRKLYGAHPGDLPDLYHLTLNTSGHVINRGIDLLRWGDDDAAVD